MKFISTKELRNTLPHIRKSLSQGEEFLLIFQSKPVAKLVPVNDSLGNENEIDVEQAALQDLEDDYLSKKELTYYMSLS